MQWQTTLILVNSREHGQLSQKVDIIILGLGTFLTAWLRILYGLAIMIYNLQRQSQTSTMMQSYTFLTVDGKAVQVGLSGG